MKSKWTFSLVFIAIIFSLAIFLLGFNRVESVEPSVVYTVYLDGEIIGFIESKESFEEYINNKEESLRKLYDVDTIYTPKGVEIKKTVTYNADIESNDSVYNKIIAIKNFTIKGIEITITNLNVEDYETKTINVLSKEVFDEALEKTIQAFIDSEDYSAFMNDTQEEIVDVGSNIESISIEETVTYKETYISTNEEIFTDVDVLAKYLLYGSTGDPATYVVKEGDTIEDIATANKLNVQEFLIANPEFTSVNNLLYTSQEVVVGLIDPIISIVVDVHEVIDEEKQYETEIQYDETLYIGSEYVEREGEDGLYRVTRKYQYINGQLSNAVVISSAELKPSVNKILVKGDKYVASVADLSYWAWPTNTPYSISSGRGYRWGSWHDAIDIIGPGYGSAIYAANNGVVAYTVTGCTAGYSGCGGGGGNYIIINHNAGNYYTVYMHLSAVYVTIGQTVARGQRIGSMGNTGNVDPMPYSTCPYCGTHLHFALYKGMPYQGGYDIDPYTVY